MYTHLEDYIYNLYRSIGINRPDQLDMGYIAKCLDVEIIYKDCVFSFDNEVVLTRGSKSEEWMDFGHEVCHYLRHCGNQADMNPLFIELQEWQADNFSMHFCVPTFMLKRIRLPPDQREAIHLIADTFNVDYQFASERLSRYYQKLFAFSIV